MTVMEITYRRRDIVYAPDERRMECRQAEGLSNYRKFREEVS